MNTLTKDKAGPVGVANNKSAVINVLVGVSSGCGQGMFMRALLYSCVYCSGHLVPVMIPTRPPHCCYKHLYTRVLVGVRTQTHW